MSIETKEDIDKAMQRGKNRDPIQFPSDLKNPDFTGNRYLIHFKIRPHSEGRSASRIPHKTLGAQDGEPKAVSSGDNNDKEFETGTSGSRKDIYLYMPENITESFSHDWDSVELGSIKRLTDLVDKVLKGEAGDAWSSMKEQATRIGTGAIEGASPFNATQLRERNLGLIINPNIEMLYKSTQIKQHAFQFKLIPKNEKEALIARQIVEIFKYHSAASYPSGSDIGVLLNYPDIFEIEFLYGGNPDQNGRHESSESWLYHIEPCALTSIEVNYTGAGQFASHYDGSLVHIDLTLNFTELMIQTKSNIKNNKKVRKDIREIL